MQPTSFVFKDEHPRLVRLPISTLGLAPRSSLGRSPDYSRAIGFGGSNPLTPEFFVQHAIGVSTEPLTPRRRPGLQALSSPSSPAWSRLLSPRAHSATGFPQPKTPSTDQNPSRALPHRRLSTPRLRKPTRFGPGCRRFLRWLPLETSPRHELSPPSAVCQHLQHNTTRGHIHEFPGPSLSIREASNATRRLRQPGNAGSRSVPNTMSSAHRTRAPSPVSHHLPAYPLSPSRSVLGWETRR